MIKAFFLGAFLYFISGAANAYIWSVAIPTEVHIVPDGLVLVGDFNNSGVTCATGPKAIYLSKTDPNFDAKLSLALTAKAAGKRIQVLINDPLESNCIQISAMGFVPIAFHYYWQLKD